jgi:hypothetical protein
MNLRFVWLLSLTCAVSACDLFTEPTAVVPGRIIDDEVAAPIQLPETVTPGTTFEVTVTTLEGGCTRLAARTEVDVTDLLAEITPYNLRRLSGVCTSDPVAIPHRARIRFTQVGTATVRIRGVSNDLYDEATPREWVTLERQVVVR